MDINQLRYFCAVAQAGSMRKAGEFLHVTQPALSKAIKLLQEELDVALFIQVGRSLVLTDDGQNFLKRAETLILQFDALRNMSSAADTSRTISIATFEVFSTHALKFLDHLDWNEHKLVLHDTIPGELERALVDRSVDIGITYMPVPHPELEHLKITEIEMGVFTLKGSFPEVPQNELPFVVPAMPITGSPSRIRGLDGWPDDAYTRKIKYQVTLLASGMELCRQGRCAGYFPLFVVDLYNKPLAPESRLVRRTSIYKGRRCFTDVYLVKRKSDVESSIHKQLAKALRKLCAL